MKIKALYLQTNDLVGTEALYTTILKIPTYRITPTEVSFLIGETELHFTKSDSESQYHIAFDVPKNLIDASYDWMKSKTKILPVTENSEFSNFELWNAKSFYFYDNNSNLLEFIARFDLENTSKKTFDSTSILYVSEIGIVTKNVPELTERLQNEYPLSVYAKQPAQENFTVLGDETGLLVLVDENRNWFPTDKKADSFPMKIVFEAEKETYELEIE